MIVDEVLPDRHGVRSCLSASAIDSRYGSHAIALGARPSVGPEGSRWTPLPLGGRFWRTYAARRAKVPTGVHIFASHVLLGSGDAWRSRTSNPGVGWTPGTDDDQRYLSRSAPSFRAGLAVERGVSYVTLSYSRQREPSLATSVRLNVESERGDTSETAFELDRRKLSPKTWIAGVRVRDSRGTRIDRKLLPWNEIWLGGRDSNPDNVVQSHVSYR
jgi:hypothetical protein